MRTKKHHLILAAVVSILCALALGNVELPQEIEPALAGIEQLYVVINAPDSEPNKDGLVFEELQEKIKRQLKTAGFKIATDDVPEKLGTILKKKFGKKGIKQAHLKFRSMNIPELRVDIDMLKLEDLQRYVFHIQTSLATKVLLGQDPSRFLKAAVWKVEPAMQVVPAQRMPAKVTEEVLEQIDAFVLAYIVANMEAAQTPDANDVGTTAKERILKPLPKPTPYKFNYVASKNSKVFHRPTCGSTMRIARKNLVGFSNRADAIRAGKRPCKLCKP
jgi:hypothetical protein